MVWLQQTAPDRQLCLGPATVQLPPISLKNQNMKLCKRWSVKKVETAVEPEELQGQVHQERLFRSETGKGVQRPRRPGHQIRISNRPPRLQPYNLQPPNVELMFRYSRMYIIAR